MSRRSATFIGFTTILMWSMLAFFTAGSGTVPPFQLASMSFLIGAVPGLAMRAMQSHKSPLPYDWRVWVLGIGGLFGYHFFYFSALRNAPTIEASLIAYLWPLLTVVLSGFLPNENLKRHHIIGVFLGLMGTGMIITGGQGFYPQEGMQFGHLFALIGAFIWAVYSVLSRRFASIPTDIVGFFCLATAVLAGICHWFFETTVWPNEINQWLAIIGLGIFPVGLAFYTWDYGVKHGDIQVLGAASYAAPLLSTIILITAGQASLTLAITMACLFITLGAIFAAKDLLFQAK